MLQKQNRILIVILTLAFMIWGSIFIYKTSFIAIDGNRHFSLIDDAMISMRYAWNFSHGLGLVWNAGERVEGYSNFLMTLLMSLATWVLSKENAVLAIQIFGILTIIFNAFLVYKIAELIFEKIENKKAIALLSFAGVLFYYPLAYWTIFGMETGLTTLFVLLGVYWAVYWQKHNKRWQLNLVGLTFGLAFLTRNDSLVFAVLTLAYLFYEELRTSRENRRFFQLLITTSIFFSFVLGQTLFRYLYYGYPLPNTYYLKVSKVPMSVRINDGFLYVLQIIKYSIVPLIFVFASSILKPQKEKWFILSLLFFSLAYQVWTGGDVFWFWRFSVPIFPLVITLFSASVINAVTTAIKRVDKISFRLEALLLFSFIVVIIAPYWQEITFRKPILYSEQNKHNMDVVIAINKLTKDDASIGVYWAGLIPYYTDRYTIDFLGKSDPYIAHTYPHLPSKITWFKTITMPGHNKYDLAYSIKKLQPDYIQRFYWGETNIRKWAIQRYQRVEYRSEGGVITIILKNDSPNLNLQNGVVLPWGSK